jgi:hypothetical protein
MDMTMQISVYRSDAQSAHTLRAALKPKSAEGVSYEEMEGPDMVSLYCAPSARVPTTIIF